MKDRDSERKPSLRISHVVYGRERRGNKVIYLVDPQGLGEKRAFSEQVVLERWRHRAFDGYRFSGSRLSPNLWRALPLVLDEDTANWTSLSEAAIKMSIHSGRELLRSRHYSVPAPSVTRALLQVCGTQRLAALVARHNDPAIGAVFGVPDLFLYAREVASGEISIARFVEVKKPEEPVSTEQHTEILFLQSLGLHARVLRLIERQVPVADAARRYS